MKSNEIIQKSYEEVNHYRAILFEENAWQLELWSGIGTKNKLSRNQIRQSMLDDFEVVRKERVLEGHEALIQALAFSQDGEMLASGSGDDTIQLWYTQIGKSLKSLHGYKFGTIAMAYSPDGRQIVSISGDNTIRFRDTQSGQASKAIRLWDIKSAQFLKALEKREVELKVEVEGEKEGLKNRITVLAYSPDGKMIAYDLKNDRSLSFLDLQKKGITNVLQGQEKIHVLAYSPNGEVIATGSDDKRVRLWMLTSPAHRLAYDFNSQ